MADNSNKRNSIAGKVATPRTTASPTGGVQKADTTETLRKAIGARLRLTTAAPHAQTLEGTLLTADPITNLIALNTRSAGPAIDAHLIPFSKIQTFQILSVAENGVAGFENGVSALGPVDVQRLKKREDDKVAKLKEQRKDRGEGVTREAQDIFDAFRRVNVPVRWHGKEIIAHEAVIIISPYRPEDCKGTSSSSDALARVKKVLEGERRKLKLREEQAKAEAEERKGG